MVLVTTGCAADIHAKSPPTWEQVNAPDIVSPYQWITGVQAFKGQLFAASSKNSNFYSFDSALYRSKDGSHWTKIESMSFNYQQYFHFGILKGKLYVGGTKPGDLLNTAELWRTVDGNRWETVTSDGFGDPTNCNVFSFSEYKGMVYAGMANELNAQVWRSPNGDPGTWKRVFTADTVHATSPNSLYVFAGKLYVTIETDWLAQAEIWRSGDGAHWEQVGANDFESTDVSPSNLVAYKNTLYLGMSSLDNGGRISLGGQLWRSQNGAKWTKVLDGGMGNIKNWKFESLVVYDNDLYTVLDSILGLTVWRSSDGQTFTKVSEAGFGKPNNNTGHWGTSLTIFNGQLYIGTTPFPLSGDGEIWRTVKKE
jgi:hypothetical protein